MATNDSENLIIPQVDRPMKVIQKLQAQCVFDRLKKQSNRGVLATGVERAVGDLRREGRHQGLTAGRRAGKVVACGAVGGDSSAAGSALAPHILRRQTLPSRRLSACNSPTPPSSRPQGVKHFNRFLVGYYAGQGVTGHWPTASSIATSSASDTTRRATQDREDTGSLLAAWPELPPRHQLRASDTTS
nr:hypothetical protein Iba_scaffold25487CG0030 [Ipomoea batatas]